MMKAENPGAVLAEIGPGGGGRLQRCRELLDAVEQALQARSATKKERVRLRTRWGTHVPMLTLLAAEVMDGDPSFSAACPSPLPCCAPTSRR